MTPESLHAYMADAAAAIIAGNRLIGRLNVESVIGSESETVDTWLLYAWTADDPAAAQLAIERAIQIAPENSLAVAGKTWIEGVKALAESQVHEREQWDAEQLAVKDTAEVVAKTELEIEEKAKTEVEAAGPVVEAGLERAATVGGAVKVGSTTDDSVQVLGDSSNDIKPDANRGNSVEVESAAARNDRVASQPQKVEPVSSLVDDVRDSLKSLIEDLGPSGNQSKEAAADSIEATKKPVQQPQSADEAQPVDASPAAEVSILEANEGVEATELVEESVAQDLEEMSASVSEAVQPVPTAESVQKVVQTPPFEEPAAQSPPAQATGEAAEPRSAVVLIVDDSPTIRKLVSMALSRDGFEVIAAKDGVDALKLLTQQRPDIILTDISMPRLGGYKLCRFIKKQPTTKSIPVLILSGKDGVLDKMKGKMAGASGYITKPFESANLVHQVRQQLLAAAGVV